MWQLANEPMADERGANIGGLGGFLCRMEVLIRKAEPHDVPRMLELVRELAAFERAPDEVTVTEEHMRDAGFGTDPVWVGWVAEIPLHVDRLASSKLDTVGTETQPVNLPTSQPANSIVGMAVCYERYSTWKGRRLYLEDIIVTESVRGLRIGEKLFKECARYAVEKEYSGMLWQVLDWNKDAIRFYDRFGAKYSAEWLNGSLELEELKEIALEL